MTRFITVDDLKNVTAIQKNVQADLLEPFIDIAQPLYILRILGTAQYDNLTGDIDTNGLTGLSASNQALLTQIRLPLAYATFYEALPFIWASISNKGITIKHSENSEPASEKEMKNLRISINNWMEFYIAEFKRWLRNNRDNYPLWREDIFYQNDYNSGKTYCSSSNFFGMQFDRNNGYLNNGFYNSNDIS